MDHYKPQADPGKARGCSTNTFVTHWFIRCLSNPSVKISLRRRHAQTFLNGASSHKRNYINIFPEILYLEGHLNCCIGSKVTAISLNWSILPTGGVASGRVCHAACTAGLFVNTADPNWVCLVALSNSAAAAAPLFLCSCLFTLNVTAAGRAITHVFYSFVVEVVKTNGSVLPSSSCRINILQVCRHSKSRYFCAVKT